LAGWVALAGCVEQEAPPKVEVRTGGISFEEFEAKVLIDEETGFYVVEGDYVIQDLAELREYYDSHIIQGALAVHTSGTRAIVWDGTQRLNLTYCVSTAFGARYNEVVTAMIAASAEWETWTGANFTHLSANDGTCANNNATLFEVVPGELTGNFPARSFFPNTDDRINRRVRLDSDAFTHSNWSLTGILRHELGHVLGFKHENARLSEAGDCDESAWAPLTAYDSDSVMHIPQCAGSNEGDLTLTSYDMLGAQLAYGMSPSRVGVIPDAASCPAGVTEVRIDMDNEDHDEASDLDGWVGATRLDSSGNITYKFCSVDGTQFRSLSTLNNTRANYAVLLLSGQCPVGSYHFERQFDNEDDDNGNNYTGIIYPNVMNTNTRLHFCLFRGGPSPATSLPNVGFNYGVFAGSSFTFSVPNGKGSIYSDDEDPITWPGSVPSTNDYDPKNVSWIDDAKLIISDGDNTRLRTARRGVPFCGDSYCNALEGQSSCPLDCGYPPPPPPPPPPPGCGENPSRVGTQRIICPEMQ
jgi:hypothetical protein